MRTAIAAGTLCGMLALGCLATPASAAQRVITYSVAARGDVGADFDAFVQIAARAYADPRGWSLGGAVDIRQVSGASDFVLWLAAPDQMTSFSSDCSPLWSCRVGRDVVINDLRFRSGSPYWKGSLDDYRVLLVNHETGHWIGFDHDACPGAGEEAPIMMQQSKGVASCVGNPWPLDGERVLAAHALGVDAPPWLTFDPPKTQGFTPQP